MRIIPIRTLKDHWKRRKLSESSLRAWYRECENANWSNSKDVKEKYGNASIITSKRVLFNIKGNDYRLIVDIEYRLKIVFIVWVGTHKEYDLIDVKKINYVKTNKK